ncbi:FUSC family protein [Pseudomonas sp. LRF_L74]|uniref:FUSC family protein n=1 Tax=Pseudomonas sp. LRF_L74 TaxID=3369422 RepID=UPI003F612612
MNNLLRQALNWHAGPPAWGPAIIAGLGCALPLVLGLFSGHPGFLWASAGAFQAAQANPLHRFGMLRMLLLTLLGACSAGLGYWSGSHPLLSLGLFAAYGFMLAWLQRLGVEAGKLGIGLAVCLCLGQGQYGVGSFRNPDAVAALFILGGLWVALLAFGLRGVHGLRTWPHMPRLVAILKVMMKHAKRLPEQRWRLHALRCTLAFALAGLIVNLAALPRGYWLTIALIGTLQLEFKVSLVRALQSCLASLCAAALLIYFGHSLQSPPLMVATILPLIVLSRAFQAHNYGLFVLQVTLSFMLLTESLSQDWHLVQTRLFNTLIGVVLAMSVALMIYGLEQWLIRRQERKSVSDA